MFRIIIPPCLILLLLLVAPASQGKRSNNKKDWVPSIPKTWDEREVESTELPLADPGVSAVHMSSSDYYRVQTHKIYKSYPIYRPDKEPPGYMEWLKQQDPQEINFDTSKFKTKSDWIKAGEIIYEEPMFYNSLPTMADVRDMEFYRQCDVPILKDGEMPFVRYVVREKGKVAVGALSCAVCHTRTLPDGTVIKGTQGNFPFDKAHAFQLRRGKKADLKEDEKGMRGMRRLERALFDTPWMNPNPHARLAEMSRDEYIAGHNLIPAGVVARQRASLFFPVAVSDLIGIKDFHYLDHTGLVRQRSIGDLMRYVAMIQTSDDFVRFGDFSIAGLLYGKDPLDEVTRFTDEQLFALALFIYSLKPPPNPNKFDAQAARGKRVFEREGCAKCHTPPLYTNNRLTPVDGYEPPKAHLNKYAIMLLSVGTDPSLALKTRRGTGYYKVPSLRGLWYRGPFEHSGSVATLEDWFDPRRTHDDYVPTGFRGYGGASRAIKGHVFGLNLSASDRKALIAFLKTL